MFRCPDHGPGHQPVAMALVTLTAGVGGPLSIGSAAGVAHG